MAFTQEQVAGQRRPTLAISDYEPGEIVVCRSTDNSRDLFVVTRKAPGSLFGRRVADDGPKHPVQRLRGVLGRPGEPECAPWPLIHGDLLYWPEWKSGLQYSQVVATRNGGTALCRWNEAKGNWTNPAPFSPVNCQYWGHIDIGDDFKRFIARIELDRALWQSSSGRSYWNAAGRWVEFARRWNLGDLEPTYRQDPQSTG
jgi:hypothetical protein